MRNRMAGLSVITAIGMLVVLLMGALVTKTESGRGCGDDWPLCNGKFVPAYTVESFIEYSHRFVTGIEGLLIVATFIAVFVYYRHSGEAKLYAGAAMFFTLLQAALGAMAVMWPQSSFVMALHFGFSLLAVASTVLLAVWIWRERAKRQTGPSTHDAMRPPYEISRSFRTMVWIAGFYCYIVVYLGAYLRHTDSMAGCAGWPLCNGEVIPELSGATGIAFIHRLAALGLGLYTLWLYIRAQQSYRHIPSIRLGTAWAMLLIVLQIASGGFVTVTLGTDWQLLTSLLHTVFITSYFSVLCFLTIQVVKLRVRSEPVASSAAGKEELV